ncbi:hypothetical protein EYC80_003913 [Monilinia laxa]|uniref:Uncharacterized protein n=1 Tax=Monilinia laxa TaxID=61186 RepID=A0A5N6KLK9_MONLA|nr:hypothetical protein EYC80_003913 [Monilinia laxa]
MNCYGYEIHEHEHLVVEKMFFVGGTELNLHFLEIFHCIYIWEGVFTIDSLKMDWRYIFDVFLFILSFAYSPI